MIIARDYQTEVTKREDHDFGVVDQKGRAIGAAIITRTAILYEREPNSKYECGYSNRKPGTYYIFAPHATRNGSSYGASQPEWFFGSEEQRAAGIWKYLEGARKRAAKLARKVAA